VNENEELEDEDGHNWELLEDGEIEELLNNDDDYFDDRMFGDDNHILD